MAPNDRDDELSRWQLPLRPLEEPLSGTGSAPKPKPVLPPITLRRDEDVDERGAPEPAQPSAPDAETASHASEPVERRPMETPDITARFVVAQLGELNERLAELTEATTERTADALADAATQLADVRAELARLTSLREYDLTEQAAGIFAAVDTGTEALNRFSTVVTDVTEDLRAILTDTLAAIGGVDGLAEAVVQGATDLAETRSELMAGIGRIQRDLATLRKRIPVQAKQPATPTPPPTAEISDEQVAYIVEAVTEAVVASLNPARSRRRPGA